MLSDREIDFARKAGAIVVEPWRPEALNPNSYDLTLGPYIARYRRVSKSGSLLAGMPLDLGATVGDDAFEIEDCTERGVIRLAPGESILGHTNEFVGGRVADGAAVNAQLRATSTAGRWGLTACRCAGHGDTGYFDRWTLEIQNCSPRPVVVPVGAVICQMVFFLVAVPKRMYQQASGNYQQHDDLEKLQKEWTPERMLPKKLKAVSRDVWATGYTRQP